eukprot:354266-Chlamydomonas_euryale.AAC.11
MVRCWQRLPPGAAAVPSLPNGATAGKGFGEHGGVGDADCDCGGGTAGEAQPGCHRAAGESNISTGGQLDANDHRHLPLSSEPFLGQDLTVCAPRWLLADAGSGVLPCRGEAGDGGEGGHERLACHHAASPIAQFGAAAVALQHEQHHHQHALCMQQKQHNQPDQHKNELHYQQQAQHMQQHQQHAQYLQQHQQHMQHHHLLQHQQLVACAPLSSASGSIDSSQLMAAWGVDGGDVDFASESEAHHLAEGLAAATAAGGHFMALDLPPLDPEVAAADAAAEAAEAASRPSSLASLHVHNAAHGAVHDAAHDAALPGAPCSQLQFVYVARASRRPICQRGNPSAAALRAFAAQMVGGGTANGGIDSSAAAAALSKAKAKAKTAPPGTAPVARSRPQKSARTATAGMPEGVLRCATAGATPRRARPRPHTSVHHPKTAANAHGNKGRKSGGGSAGNVLACDGARGHLRNTPSPPPSPRATPPLLASGPAWAFPLSDEPPPPPQSQLLPDAIALAVQPGACPVPGSPSPPPPPPPLVGSEAKVDAPVGAAPTHSSAAASADRSLAASDILAVLLQWQALSHRVVSAACSPHQDTAWEGLPDDQLRAFVARVGGGGGGTRAPPHAHEDVQRDVLIEHARTLVAARAHSCTAVVPLGAAPSTPRML